MRNPESFDAYYAETRTRFLHEAYALTGDEPAARAALRDAYVIAWHHWRKVALLDDRDAYVRSLAHRRARRRHKTRIWHRDKALDDSVLATFEALSQLSSQHRQLLVLSTLSPLSMSEIARAVGLPRTDAERELQSATAQFSLDRDVPTTELRPLLEELAQPLEETRWPRATVIRRNGAARRRAHTIAGAAVATAALLVSGSLVATGSDATTTSLSRERTTTALRLDPPPTLTSADMVLDESVLLASDQLTRFGSKVEWSETSTSDNTDGDGLVVPCQRDRFSDPEGLDAIVRTWQGSTTTTKRSVVRQGGKKRVIKKRVTSASTDLVQVVEMSRDAERAQQSFTTASLWYAGCNKFRTQLLSTAAVEGVGESARQFRLRNWGKAPSTISVGLARTGNVVTTTVMESRSGPVDAKATTTALAAAVNRLCGSPGAGPCAGRARSVPTDPMAIGTPPGLLMTVDLPPVAIARGPWVGTDPAPVTATNSAATRCDNTSFKAKGIRGGLTRTFLFLKTPNADRLLGLTQTIGLMKKPAAKKFVSVVASRIRKCGAANLGTSVTTLASVSTPKRELHVWALSIELNDKDSFPFLMAIGREGNAVSQVGFTPGRRMTMSRPDFVALARRSLERLSNLSGATP